LLISIWGCGSPVTYCQPADAAGFTYCRSQEWALHSPSSTGFLYLAFSWVHAPFVFSSIQLYLPVAITVLFYLELVWGSTPPTKKWMHIYWYLHVSILSNSNYVKRTNTTWNLIYRLFGANIFIILFIDIFNIFILLHKCTKLFMHLRNLVINNFNRAIIIFSNSVFEDGNVAMNNFTHICVSMCVCVCVSIVVCVYTYNALSHTIIFIFQLYLL
jgi:hypothetical protein